MSDVSADKPAPGPAKIGHVKAKAQKPAPAPTPAPKKVAAAAANPAPAATAKPTKAQRQQAAFGNGAVARSLERAGGGHAPAPIKVDTSTGQAVLDSVKDVPPSQFAAAVNAAVGAQPAVLAHERQELKKSYPEIDRPTGMPRRPKPAKAPVPGQKGEGPAPEQPGARAPAPPEPGAPAETTNPADNVAVQVEEPLLQKLSSWWSWLVDVVRSFLSELPMTDDGVDTSAGERPHMDLSGDADPAQNQKNLTRSHQAVDKAHLSADRATEAQFGDKDVAPTSPEEKLRPSHDPAVRAAKSAQLMKMPPSLPSKERDEFDARAGHLVADRAGSAADKRKKAQTKFEADSLEIRREGQKELDEEVANTKREQLAAKQKGIADVDAERESWRGANRKVSEKFETDAEEKRQETDKQIDDKVKETNQTAEDKYADAERQAQEEKRKAEQRAEELKKEQEDKDESWWDTLKGAVKSAFNAIRQAFRDLWDGLRKLVHGIIEGVKKLVRGLIEAARVFVVGLIRGFGALLKGFVTIALAAFPEEAKRARAAIDGVVNRAENAVNDFADELKKRSDQILDAMGDALDTALAVLEEINDFCLELFEDLAIVLIDVMWVLWKLQELLLNIGPFIEGVKKIYDNPSIIIDGIKKAIGDMMAGVASAAEDWVKRAVSGAERHLGGIWRHLKPKLEYLRDHWWEAIKQAGKDLLWPWPGVKEDFEKIWQAVKDGWDAIGNLDADAAKDAILAIWRGLNAVAGRLYGWFFIASVLVGAILGGIFGVGAGAIPGAIAGAEFALAVGEGLLISTVAAETATILNAGQQLLEGNRPQKDEDNYELISSSGLTLAITGVMFILGALAVKFASAIISSAARALGVDLEAIASKFKVNVPPEGKPPVVDTAPPAVDPTAPKVDPVKPPPGQDVPQPKAPTDTAPAPKDTAAPPKDTTQPPKDTAQPPKDTAQPPKDAAQPPKDTAQPPKDTAQPPKDPAASDEPAPQKKTAKDEVPPDDPLATEPVEPGSPEETTTKAEDVGSKEPEPGKPGSKEHKAARWKEYQERGGKWKKERWEKVYDNNMKRARIANQVADDLHAQLGWGKREVTVDVEGVPRRLDIADVETMRGVEVKSGYQTATQDNLWEIARDQILKEQGWDIRWHFKGKASGPLQKALQDAKIPYTIVP